MNRNEINHYGKALFEYSLENNIVEELYSDASFFNELILNNDDFVKFLQVPTITKEKKKEILDKCLSKEINKTLYIFILIMLRKNVLHLYKYIYNSYLHYYNEYKGIIEGKLYTAFLLNKEQINNLEEILSKKEKKKVYLTQLLDNKILGGVKIYLNDKIYDYSLESKIEKIKELLIK